MLGPSTIPLNMDVHFSEGGDGDDSHLAAAPWSGERKSLVDPSHQQRPGTPVSPCTESQGTKTCLIRT